MVEKIVADMMDAIEEARKMKPSRELSLVITKLEEAMHWYEAHRYARKAEAGKTVPVSAS